MMTDVILITSPIIPDPERHERDVGAPVADVEALIGDHQRHHRRLVRTHRR
jgi:hypothetical protein